ncbi:oxidoreductase [Larsenimonas salina]|uniref:oxidoreductase n=1 Tax=Larsenimonas salina TaxID=1295565 RepID=UPI0020745B49|nr:oxidoreductase [Larsenimonas salina]MCM5705559.1 oxidoreductase [Larsenimonas salina]
MTKAINVGLIGFGLAGTAFHAPLITTTEGLSLHTVATRQNDKVKKAYPNASVGSVDEVLEHPEIELVVVASPNDTHADLAIRAMQAGKHVVIDKPFALNYSEALKVKEISEAIGKQAIVFHNRRWDGDFLTVRQLIEQGTLGALTQFESHFDRFRPDVDASKWREQPGEGSGIWMDLGAHLGDQALALFGPPRSVFADLGTLRDQAQATDYFHVMLRYDGFRVILHSTTVACAPTPRFSLHGTEGSFTIYGLDPQEDMLRRGARPTFDGWGRDATPGEIARLQNGAFVRETVPTQPGNYPAFYQGVRDALRGGESPVSLDSALQVMRLLALAKQSDASSQALSFDAPIGQDV